jgi:hypothetical protein
MASNDTIARDGFIKQWTHSLMLESLRSVTVNRCSALGPSPRACNHCAQSLLKQCKIGIKIHQISNKLLQMKSFSKQIYSHSDGILLYSFDSSTSALLRAVFGFILRSNPVKLEHFEAIVI